MNKIIFELYDVKETPNSKPKLGIEVRYEPLRQNGRAKELADRFLQAIDDYNLEMGGTKN